ncbi:MAG: class I SAM-dependent methyltransferase [Chitinophagales bacterium]|nr:class I SAM-dependent methyltransferase [Chitinophagales bacterium]
MTNSSLSLPAFPDYELIDCGDGYKLERYGQYIISRHEPQAIWKKNLNKDEWDAKANAHFQRNKADINSNKDDAGNWIRRDEMPDNWFIGYSYQGMSLKFKLALTAFKHLGIFPEQAVNWNYILDNKKIINQQRVLNLFAYTGGSSLAAKFAGGDVVHVDAVKKAIDWASENQQLSGLHDIRWIVEDAMIYARREITRGKQYAAIILDPPAYGRGPKGEKWLLEEQLDELIAMCSKLLYPHNSMFIINLYSMGYSALVLETIMKTHFKSLKNYEFGDLYIQDSFGKKLPTGIYFRFVL